MKAKLSNFIALDLGSSKISTIAAIVDKKGDPRILSQGLHHSGGVRSGVILDLKAAENTIISAIYALEKDCGKNIKQIALSLSGAKTKSYYLNNKIKLANHPISKQDVTKLIQKTLSEFKVKDQEIIHYFPIEFTIDDNNFIDDPIGVFGRELSCQLHVIAVESILITNLINCFAKCQIEISTIVLAIYASGLACLSEDEKNLGSIIIDLGSDTTSFGIFLSGKLIYSNYVDIGSRHITSDIAKVFSVNLFLAEKLKVLYGNACPSPFDKDNIINMDDIDDYNENTTMAITSSNLAQVIYPRVEEILLAVKEKYDELALDHMISRRLVITGGGSMLRGVKELASKIFEKQVRIGKPHIIPGFAEDYNPGMYSTAIGMIKNQVLKLQKNSFVIGADEDKTWFKKAIKWLKANI